ncbi:ABC transporter permease [Niabella insulamsoli]|uniref:ABC transporter permease n=1 Tax=Niabella insulamsoli TaxID=3144874 RepID=UPI0031FBFE02
MNKTFLIIQREYLTRVKKKTFIISTLLFPLLYLGLIFGTSYIGEKSSTQLKIAVIDSSGKFTAEKIAEANEHNKANILTLVQEDPRDLSEKFEAKGYDAYVVIPKNTMVSGTANQISIKSNRTLGAVSDVRSKLNAIWNDIKYEDLNIDTDKRQTLSESHLNVSAENLRDKKSDGSYAMVIGYVAGFLVYFILLIYGSQVMMGVMEEKTNRIAEVMVSSVKPFQLMLGKIIGIALVALTQFLLWVAFVFVIYNAGIAAADADSSSMGEIVGGVQKVFTSVNMPLILSLFAFYFLGGFFFFSSIYAAVGSAVNEDIREAQSLSFPITMIIIFAIFMLTIAMKDPTSPVAVWTSIIPFTSPIVMMARVAYGVPGTVAYWELALSMAVLIASFLFMVWFSGKIYRTGILMYGKKPTWKEMMKWAMRK